MIGEGDLLLQSQAVYYVAQVEQSYICTTYGPTGETVVVTLTEEGSLPPGWSKIDRGSLGSFLEAVADDLPGSLEMAECVTITKGAEQ